VTTVIAYLAGLAALLFGVGVVVSARAVHTVLSLLGNILSLAVLFLVYDAQFLAFMEVAVYAGAILMLFLFVIALLAAGKEEDPAEYGPELPGQVAAGAGAAALLTAVLLAAFQMRELGVGAGHAILKGFGTVEQVGAGLFTTYLLPFELTAPVLLAAIVGVVVLSRGRGERSPAREEEGRG
jgi:NADH-quinone oxidoreductase subunit J